MERETPEQRAKRLLRDRRQWCLPKEDAAQLYLDIAAEICTAVQLERERCAKVADEFVGSGAGAAIRALENE